MDYHDWLEWNERGDTDAPPLAFYMQHESYDYWRWGKMTDEEFHRRAKKDWKVRRDDWEAE